ncbi:MAG: hypothetical protein HQL59_10900, partial [Magnetococcales bacterium]|nr:hypothetical protein [Magnetococcales bacterium]
MAGREGSTVSQTEFDELTVLQNVRQADMNARMQVGLDVKAPAIVDISGGVVAISPDVEPVLATANIDGARTAPLSVASVPELLATTALASTDIWAGTPDSLAASWSISEPVRPAPMPFDTTQVADTDQVSATAETVPAATDNIAPAGADTATQPTVEVVLPRSDRETAAAQTDTVAST